MNEDFGLADISLGVEEADQAGGNLGPQWEEPAAAPASLADAPEALNLLMALGVEMGLRWVSRRNRWEPPTADEVDAHAMPLSRIIHYLFPDLAASLARLPVAVDAIALGGAWGRYTSKREGGIHREKDPPDEPVGGPDAGRAGAADADLGANLAFLGAP